MKIIHEIGNRDLLQREKTLFLCSKMAPISKYDLIFGWVDSLGKDDCVICFNSSELEEEVMKALLVNQVPTILVVMNRFTDKYNIQIMKAVEENRILIIVLERDEARGKGATPRLRNEFVITMADQIVCGYINKNGSIFPLLAGQNNVRYLENEMFCGVSEDRSPTHQRWKVWEDKTLLRMFYEDMGIHAIKKQLNRTYLSVKNRIRAITLPVEVLKGREFEDFVLELFDLNENSLYSLLEWRGDKSMGEVSPVSNTYPDFVIEYKKGNIRKKFSIECKWRVSISKNHKIPLFQPEQILRYQEYAREKNQEVVIVLGIGGEPSMPENLYLIPVDALQEVQSKPSLLKQYMRKEVGKWLTFEELCKPQQEEE
jgi:hypothetical protein